MSKQPIGFMSYLRFVDEYENGRLTEFCKRLSGEVRMHTGEHFEIFQDRKNITWGQEWKQRIDDTIDGATFLIPIITAGFFKSSACREELERFLVREKKLGRNDLIFPVYYVTCGVLEDEEKRLQDPLAQIIHTRNRIDWRDMRFEPFTNPEMWRTFNRMAQQIVEAMERDVNFQKPIVTVTEDVDEVEAKFESGVEPDVSHAQLRSHKIENRSEPPTHIVDALHRGHFTTISEALKVAKAGDQILVRPGTYQEAIVIDKPLEIIGDGPIGEVVIESKNATTVRFHSTMGRLSNLVLRQMGSEKYFCIDISQGRLDVDGCDITSKKLSGVSVRSGASPQFRRNRIHSCGQSGVLIREGSSGTFEDNEIFGNFFSNVFVKAGANPTFRRNRIFESKQSGIYIFEQGYGLFEDNEVFGNGTVAVIIKDDGGPVIRRNRLYESKKHGVLVSACGLGSIEDNEIFGNGRAGVLVEGDSAPQLRRNDIHTNAYAGVLVGEGSKPVCYRNKIHDNKQGGVYCYEGGGGLFEENEIFSNKNNGFLVKDQANPTLNNNVINKNGKRGIFIGDDAQATLKKNDLRGNNLASLYIVQSSIPNVIVQGNLKD
ncbi:right-handed parallel beta-helix repeat-containing protein [Pseudomonas frederiksbergensis]|uniref:mannuronan 5-epimerase n=1 Tax=Pseudomonas frederiksbergensis TaxID=104087 RepID=A0A6L5BZD6_9PSED|nr:right-handed parallel beta-helix repeat-containing protein [Pseudomonas frederiksbergensis]KAF2393282.1 Mannuronan C5-epimerase [Pseudomonas frederiksbergensis]